MKIATLHDWDLSPKEAVQLQRKLADRIVGDTPLPSCGFIAGADVSYNLRSPTVYAGVVVLRLPDLTVVEQRGVVAKTSFPYVPGLLSFREIPVVLRAFAKLKQAPDVVMCDGQGFAHPRRMGLACHLGLWLNLPCFGCAKSRLHGEEGKLLTARGSQAPLRHGTEVIGATLRTRTGVKPVYVSVGHRIDLASAIRITLATNGGYRIPEPTRQAHLLVNAMRRSAVPA